MTREQYIKYLIKNQYPNMKEFAHTIDMPYSTLLSIVNGSIGGAAIDNVIKICKGLSISISELQENSTTELYLTDSEKELILKYRENPAMQQAINKLLGVE